MDDELSRLLKRAIVSALNDVPALYNEHREYAICRLFPNCDLNPEYGLVVYEDLSGKRHCTSFFINYPALPKSAKVAEVLNYFFDEIYAAKGYTLIAWANQVTLHTSMWGKGYALVGPCIVSDFNAFKGGVTQVGNFTPWVEVGPKFKPLIDQQMRDSQYTNVPVLVGEQDRFDVVVQQIPENEKHRGVFLLEDMGLTHASQYLKPDCPDHIVQVLYYPSNTKIITSFYLNGLFKEAFMNCPSPSIFLQKYKLANVNNADSLLYEWAHQTKKWKK